MKKQFMLLSMGIFLAAAAHAQKIKKAGTDTVKAGRANDRLKNAGPVNGWPVEDSKGDSASKIKSQPGAKRQNKPGNR